MQYENMSRSQAGATVALDAPAAMPRRGSQFCKCKFNEGSITMARGWNIKLRVLVSCCAILLCTSNSDANTAERISAWGFSVGGDSYVEDGM